jgi:Secretion system C-terminal sorting domain
MKNIIYLCASCFLIFFSSTLSFGQCTFTPLGTAVNGHVGGPYVFAFAGIEPYLARSIQMDLLPTLLLNQNTAGNYSINYTTVPNSTAPCTNPCSQDCRYSYCCSKYNEDINMLADINAAYVFSTGYYEDNLSAWGGSDVDHDPRFGTNGTFIELMKRIPRDINLAYDRKSLRRPIIDAFLAEDIKDPVPYDKVLGGRIRTSLRTTAQLPSIDDVKIPKSVITFFRDNDFMTNAERDYYLPGGVPSDVLRFDIDNVTWTENLGFVEIPGNPPVSYDRHIDVNKIEGRMWVYFICKQYIDMGYTSINFSQADFFYEHDLNSPISVLIGLTNLNQTQREANNLIYSNDVKRGMMNLYKCCQNVRQYAFENGKFLLMWNQSTRMDYAYKLVNGQYIKDTYSDGHFKYIFDFNSSALRVREVDDAHLNVGRNLLSPTTSQPPMLESEFNTKIPTCATSCIKAVADPGSGVNYEINGSGNSPRPWRNLDNTTLPNGFYYEKQPTHVYFDGGGGRGGTYNEGRRTGLSKECTNWSGADQDGTFSNIGIDNAGAWGNDDSRWFYEFRNSIGLDNRDACVVEWLTYNYVNIRKFDYSDHTSFMNLPGRIMQRFGQYDTNLLPTDFYGNGEIAGPVFRLADPINLPIVNAIKNDIWKVNQVESSPTDNSNSISYTFNANGYNAGDCSVKSGKKTCRGNSTYGTYTFSVNNPDKSSIYDWNIKWSDNSWEPYTTYGKNRVFIPTRSGSFTIFLTQTNLGLPTSTNGKAVATKVVVVNSRCVYNPLTDCRGTVLFKPVIITPPTVSNDFGYEITESQKLSLLQMAQTMINNKQTIGLNSDVPSGIMNIKTYPQPVTSSLTLAYELNKDGNFAIEIINIVGEVVQSITTSVKNKGIYTDNIDLSDFVAGLYIIKLNFNGNVKNIKVVKY